LSYEDKILSEHHRIDCELLSSLQTPNMPTIALFGATGNVGKALVKALKEMAAEEVDFLVFTRSERDAKEREDPRFQRTALPKRQDGSTDTDALAEILKSKKVETCFLCIPQLLVASAEAYVKQDLLPALTQAKVVRMVKVGTGNAEHYEYGRRHIAAEKAIRDTGVTLTVLRGGDFSSNPQWLGPAPPGAPLVLIDVFKGLSTLSYVGLSIFRSMGNLANFLGTAKEPFLHLSDFGEALAACLLNAKDHEDKTYKVYSDVVSMQDVADVYSSLLGRKIHVLDMNDDEIRALLAMDGFKGEMADIALEMFSQFKKGVYEPDSSWDGFQKLCPGREPRRFKDFAAEKVNAGWKPLKLW
jgi:uncharacterized protein YbjT (DUF2867 family)